MNLKTGLTIVLLLILIGVGVVAGSCLRGLTGEPAAIWTPAPLASPAATREAILPTVAPRPAALTATAPAPVAQPTIPLLPTPAPAAALTPDPKRITITEADVARALASGVAAQQGLTTDGLAVRFTGGKLRLTATTLAYGPIRVRDLTLVGVLVAQQGQLQLQTETISPSGLVTALIPALANQALAQYAGQWYIEDVQTLEGQLAVRIR